MNHKPAEVSDKITILIFKDNFAARTFQIPLKWISQFGTVFALFTILALAGIIFAVRYSILAPKNNPIQIRELEQEILDLKSNIKLLENNNNESTAKKNIKKTTTSPAPVVSVLFAAFSPNISGDLPNPATLHFVIQNPETSWQQNTLNIRFTLQFRAAPPTSNPLEEPEEKENQGSQQGRIVILARGPDTLLAYPSGVLSHAGAPQLLNPEEGESFSVSRFREVSADFGPLPSKDSIQDLEIYIFNKEGQQILAYQKISPKDSE